MASARLSSLPPEIFPLIAGHLPLSILPRTLLALTLASKGTCTLVFPILYSHLILQNEASAFRLINELLSRPDKGQLIRGLHIHSKLSKHVHDDPSRIDVVQGLHRLVKAGRLPLMHTLELHLEGDGWFRCEDLELLKGYGRFRQDFWKTLREHCPEFHTLKLCNFGDAPERDPWLEKCGLFEVEGIRNLTLRFAPGSLQGLRTNSLLSMITRLSTQLRVLNLAQSFRWSTDESMELTPLLSLTFPNLESITLRGQSLNKGSTAMEFWSLHPKLEYIKLNYPDYTPRFDVNGVMERAKDGSFLPALRHLSAPFNDIRALGPLPRQLISLSVWETINAQLPYILRAIAKDGLPKLQSLNFFQNGNPGGDLRALEGALWWETLEGEFKTEPWRGGEQMFRKSVVNDPEWMNSIVLACPNLRELALQANDTSVSNYTNVIPSLMRLPRLERLFYWDYFNTVQELEEDKGMDEFIDQARATFNACQNLVEIGDIYAIPPAGCATAIVERGEDGAVKDVKVRLGNGMVIGQEDLAFPRSHDRGAI